MNSGNQFPPKGTRAAVDACRVGNFANFYTQRGHKGSCACTTKLHGKDEGVGQPEKTGSLAEPTPCGGTLCNAVPLIRTENGDQLDNRGVCIRLATCRVSVSPTDGLIDRAVDCVGGLIHLSTEAQPQPARIGGHASAGI